MTGCFVYEDVANCGKQFEAERSWTEGRGSVKTKEGHLNGHDLWRISGDVRWMEMVVSIAPQ